jgi:subtilisin family serine protease
MTKKENINCVSGIVLVCIILVQAVFAQEYHKDHFIIKLKKNVSISIKRGADRRYEYGIGSLDKLNDQHDVLRMEKIFNDEVNNELACYYRMRLVKPRVDIETVKNAYLNLSDVESAELVPIAKLATDQNHPNDPLYNFGLNGGSGVSQEQWYLYNDGDMNDNCSNDGTYRADIKAPEAWAIQTGKSDVIIGIIDTGIKWDHEDIQDNIWINNAEDANNSGRFDPSPISQGGDFGDKNGDGYPGIQGVDDDGDGYVDFNDPGVYDIFTNGKDDDGDGTTEDELGGTLDDSPGTPGVDDDGDGAIDDYDGAIFDDDENGYPDDVIGWDFVNWDPIPEPWSGFHPEHGTFISGDAGATGNNGKGISGSMQSCKIMTLKGAPTSTNIYYATKMGAHIINMSWEGTNPTTGIDYAYDNNVVLVASAGNDGELGVSLPAANSKAIAVAGINSYDEKHPDSNYGLQIDVCAAYGPITGLYYEGGYVGWGYGTSHASPIVAGIAGLIISQFLDCANYDYSNEDIRDILKNTADNIDAVNQGQPWEGLLGSGRINAYKALKYTLENYGGTIGGVGKTVTFHEDITIQSGAVLTVLAGTTVKFAAGTRLTINGSLTAEGTSSNPIIFQSATSPPRDWYGIVFENGSNGYLRCCEINDSENMITVESGADVTMCDDNEIILQPGFIVELGGEFYAYVDASLSDGLAKIASYSNQNSYEIVENDENTSEDSTQTEQNNLKANYSLSQNYPNPFNPTTAIKYCLKEETKVTIKVYNLLGKEIITLVNETQPAGYQSITWNGTDHSGNPVPSGIYICQMKAGNFTKSQKMVLMK